MGLFGWGETDDTTPAERAGWKDRAKEQMDQQSGKTPAPKPEATDSDQPKRHARRKGLFD